MGDRLLQSEPRVSSAATIHTSGRAVRVMAKVRNHWAPFSLSCLVLACANIPQLDRTGHAQRLTVCVAAAAPVTQLTADLSQTTPITGWVTSYDTHVHAEVAKASGLLALSPVRMRGF